MMQGGTLDTVLIKKFDRSSKSDDFVNKLTNKKL